MILEIKILEKNVLLKDGIDNANNAAFGHNVVAHTNKEGAYISFARQEIDDEDEKIIKIMLDFTIQ